MYSVSGLSQLLSFAYYIAMLELDIECEKDKCLDAFELCDEPCLATWWCNNVSPDAQMLLAFYWNGRIWACVSYTTSEDVSGCNELTHCSFSVTVASSITFGLTADAEITLSIALSGILCAIYICTRMFVGLWTLHYCAGKVIVLSPNVLLLLLLLYG